MNQHDKKVYREGYNKGKLKAKIIRTTLVQRIPSVSEKEWESKINYFAWAAIICLLLFGITAELYAHNWNSTKIANEKLNYTIKAYNQCIEQSKSHPIITQVDATVYHYINDDLEVTNTTIRFGDPFPIHIDGYVYNFCIRGKCFGAFSPGQYIFIPMEKVGEVYTCTNPIEGPGNKVIDGDTTVGFDWAYYCNIDDFAVREAE